MVKHVYRIPLFSVAFSLVCCGPVPRHDPQMHRPEPLERTEEATEPVVVQSAAATQSAPLHMASAPPTCPVDERVWCTLIAATKFDYVQGIAARPDGGVVVVGSFKNPVDFGGGERVSRGEGDGFVLALGADGGYLWDYAFGSAGHDTAVAVVVGTDGAVYVTGAYAGPIDFGGGPRAYADGADALAVALDRDGAYRWDWTASGPGYDYGRDIAIAADGTVAVSGHYGDGTVFAKGKPRHKDANGNSNVDGFVMVFDQRGNKRWHWALESSEWAGLSGMVFDGKDLLVTGRIQGKAQISGRIRQLQGMDAVVARLDPAGQEQWVRVLGGMNTHVALDVALTPDGLALVLGYESKARSEGFLMGFDSSGATRSHRRWPTTPGWMAMGEDGRMLVGDFDGMWFTDSAGREPRQLVMKRGGHTGVIKGGHVTIAGNPGDFMFVARLR